MSIVENLQQIRESIPDHVKIVAVSKTHPSSSILEAYNAGQRIFGESRPQELLKKYEELPKNIQWHQIGHLQTNKVKYIAPFVSLIHSVDSLELLKMINREAKKNDRVIDCLIQMRIAQEDTKFGFSRIDAEQLFQSSEFTKLENIRICGVMGMASYVDDEEQIRDEFNFLVSLFKELKIFFFMHNDFFSEVSMGMSGDYLVAIEEGSTMVRIGSSIFGERDYSALDTDDNNANENLDSND